MIIDIFLFLQINNDVMMGSSEQQQQKENSAVSGTSSVEFGSDDASIPPPSRRGRASPICGGTGTGSGRVSLTRLAEGKKARRCRFYRNGDAFFPGIIVAVAADKHRSWGALLGDLTRLLDHPLHPPGIKQVFSLEGVKLQSICQLVEGGEYVAASGDIFRLLD